MINQEIARSFSCKFLNRFWMKFSVLLRPVGLLKLVLNLFHTIIFKGENSVHVIL